MRGVRAYKVEYYQTARKEALRLAWMGVSPTVISRRVGVSSTSVRNWMKEEGLATSKKDAGTFPCPECGNRMEKQRLFFWKCPCGAEWWPRQEIVPENPECWNLPIRLEIEPETHLRLKELVEDGVEQSEIAEILNQEGHKTALGKPWSRKSVSDYTIRKGLKFNGTTWEDEYEEVLEQIRELARLGYLHREIAEILNMWGLKNKRGTPWDDRSVQMVFATRVKETSGRRKNRLSRAKLPVRMANMIHPWRRAEYARVWSVRRKYKRDEMSSMSGGDDAK